MSNNNFQKISFNKKLLVYFVKLLLIFHLLESPSFSDSEIELETNWKEYDKNRKTTFFYSTDVRKFPKALIMPGGDDRSGQSIGSIGGIKVLTLESIDDFEVIESVRFNYKISYRVIRCDNFKQNIVNLFYNQDYRPLKHNSSYIYKDGSALSLWGMEYFYIEDTIISSKEKKIKQKKLLKKVKKLCKDFFPNGTKIEYSKEFLEAKQARAKRIKEQEQTRLKKLEAEKKRKELIKNYKYISSVEDLKHKLIYNKNENVKYSFHEDFVKIKSTFREWTANFRIKDEYLYLEYPAGINKIQEAFQIVNKKIVLWRSINSQSYIKNNHFIYDVNNPSITNKSEKITDDKLLGRSMYADGVCCIIFKIDPMGFIIFEQTNIWKKFTSKDFFLNDTAWKVKEKGVQYKTTKEKEIISGPVELQTNCIDAFDLLNLKNCESIKVKLKIDSNLQLYFKYVNSNEWIEWRKMKYEN